MGIKPGSKEFHALKSGSGQLLDSIKNRGKAKLGNDKGKGKSKCVK